MEDISMRGEDESQSVQNIILRNRNNKSQYRTKGWEKWNFLNKDSTLFECFEAQRFKYNLIDSPSCDLCMQDLTPLHYSIYCPVYSVHRNIFNNRLQAELSSDISDKQKLLNTILHGLNINNTETNKILIDIINVKKGCVFN